MTPRDRAIAWARDVASDPRALVLDSETLSLRPEDGICDLAIVAMDGTLVLDSLIDPVRPIPRESSLIHGIYDIDVEDAPSFIEVYADLSAVLTGRRVVIYNRDFDAAVLDACCDRYELPAFGAASWECAMKAYSDFDGTRSTNFRRPGLKWWKLAEACAAMGVRLDGAHRARADAEATRRLVVAMAASAGPADTAEQAGLFTMGTKAGPARDWTR
jgi:DNA polymerase-3 subunit epsilon